MTDSTPIYPEDHFCNLFPKCACNETCPFFVDSHLCPSIKEAPDRLRKKIAEYKRYISQIEKFLKEEG